jgi:Spy/CpxP family protein refolding chaperone
LSETRASWWFLGLAGLAAVSACATTPIGTSVPPPGLRQELDEGSAAWFLNATSALTLSYDQQALLLKVGQTVRAQSEPVQVARRQLLGLLLDGIASGTFDDARIAATVQQVVSAAEGRGPAVVQALMQLHQGLSPTQRQTVASTILQAVNGQAAQPTSERQQLQQRVDSLTAGVGLTQAQSDQIRSTIVESFQAYAPDLQEEAERRRKQLGGLAQGFPAIYFEPSPANVTSALDLEAKSKRLVAFARALTPILTPAQRQQVAALIRQRNSID